MNYTGSNLVSALEQIKTIVDAALAPRRPRVAPKKAQQSAAKTITKLPDHLLRLRDEGFFSQPQNYNDAHKKLSPTYACDAGRVKVALLRLGKAKKLRKTSKIVNGKKLVAYVW